MKRILILSIGLILFSFYGTAQIIKDIDEITPFHEELAAIRKGNKWAFINTKGETIIPYREDIVASKGSESYPYFSNERCLIKQIKNDIYYYGYIDKSGKTVIEPEYLNAIPFNDGYAIVLKIAKEELGKNDLLDKKVISYSYDEVVINPNGTIITHLSGPEHLIFSKDKLKKRPGIQSYLISSNLVALNNNSRWEIHVINTTKE
ncbi:WG repeat-containing protein [Aquimarina algiphila]|uniref:WG repeat-containing protein n=1 Tax=Aquimarina algiphila TaxID=2047982 RepID=UPI00233129A4|nr:WG repeat-containing protein [Aquimarina algiphila]